MEQLDRFRIIQEENKALIQARDFSYILERVGSTKFEKSDLEFYFRTLGEIQDRIESSRSTIKTFIQVLGQFSKKTTKDAISMEAKETIDNQILEIILLLNEISIGRDSEFSQLAKNFRRRK